MKHRLSNDELDTYLHEDEDFGTPQKQIMAERRESKLVKKHLSNKPEKRWEPKKDKLKN